MSLTTFQPIDSIECTTFKLSMKLSGRKVLRNATVMIQFSEDGLATEIRLMSSPKSMLFDMMVMRDIKVELKEAFDGQEMLAVLFHQYRTRVVLRGAKATIDQIHAACMQPQTQSPVKPVKNHAAAENDPSAANRPVFADSGFSPPAKKRPEDTDRRPLTTIPTKQPVLPTEPISLSSEQVEVLQDCRAGHQVYFSGSAGTGKSFLLKAIIDHSRKQHGSKAVFILAMTALVACELGGMTVHRFLSLPVQQQQDEALDWTKIAEDQAKVKSVQMRCQAAKVIVIDEVSMLPLSMFECLHGVLRRTRGSAQVMGGVQVVCTGDFCQLPPVKTNGVYCFQSTLWPRVFLPEHSHLLSVIYRQQHDLQFARLLEDIRFGNLTESAAQLLDACVQKELPEMNGVLPSVLVTHRTNCDQQNQERLEELPGTRVEFLAEDRGDLSYLQGNSCVVKRILQLKVGAQVILIKTIDTSRGLVNGARGIVVKFAAITSFPIVRFVGNEREHVISRMSFPQQVVGDRIIAERRQIPLDLAWAMSVHKAQGSTVTQAVIDVQNAFEVGHVYVALSRVQSLAGLRLTHRITADKVKADENVVAFYQSLQREQLLRKQRIKK